MWPTLTLQNMKNNQNIFFSDFKFTSNGWHLNFLKGVKKKSYFFFYYYDITVAPDVQLVSAMTLLYFTYFKISSLHTSNSLQTTIQLYFDVNNTKFRFNILRWF